jgi:hypothetical protein
MKGQFLEGQTLLDRFDVTSVLASVHRYVREFAEEINDE